MAQELADMRQCLESLPVIEQSKGLLMGLYSIDADTAFTLLRRWSSHTNLKLRDISRMLVDAAKQPDRRQLTELVEKLQARPPRTWPRITDPPE